MHGSSVDGFSIGQKAIGRGRPCLIVAEVAQAHDGSLGMAHAFIDAVARTGADAIKFQTHIAAAESSPEEPWRVAFSPQDATRFDYWRRMEFTEEQWRGLREHAERSGLLFLSSPFSIEAVELLCRVGVGAWKVASGEVTNTILLDRVAQSGLPVLVSTGMSPLDEVDAAVERIRARGAPLALFQCTTAYPCPPEKVGLNLVPALRERYGCPVGLSDHSGTVYPALAATALGVDLLELHVTLGRDMFGPDVPASVTTDELRQLVEGVRFIETMNAHPVAKDEIAGEMATLRRTFTKSLAIRCDLPAGSVLQEEHLTLKKPGSGLPAQQLPRIVGRRLKRAVRAGAFLAREDVA